MIKKFWNTMSGPNRSLLFIVLAILIAGLVTFWANSMLKGDTKIKAQKVETMPIAVAAVDVNWGEVLAKEQVKTLPYLKANLPAGYFADANALVGRTVLFPVKANEPILDSRLAPMNFKGGGVAAVVGQGKRAMAVKVDKVSGISGFIHPGNRVDVLVTLPEQNGSNKPPIAKIVLENVLVLATGTQMEADKKKEKAAPVDVITLEVTPEEGEKLALAATEGKLQLSLRNFTDTQEVHTRGTTPQALLASYSSMSAPAPKPGLKRTSAPTPHRVVYAPPTQSPVVTVEIIQGNDVQQYKFGRGE